MTVSGGFGGFRYAIYFASRGSHVGDWLAGHDDEGVSKDGAESDCASAGGGVMTVGGPMTVDCGIRNC